MLTPRIAAAVALIGLGAASASAQLDEGSETVNALIECREIAGDAERLACMDARLADFSTAVDDGRLRVVERTAVRAVERESFGLSIPSVDGLGALFGRGGAERSGERESETLADGAVVTYRAEGGIEELSGAPVRRVETNPYGKFVVTLENGQVWVQTDSTRVSPVRRRHLDDLTADIERGMFGSYSLRLSHSGPSFKAERRD